MVKATADMTKLRDNSLKAEKQNYVNTKNLVLGHGVNNAARACKFLHE